MWNKFQNEDLDLESFGKKKKKKKRGDGQDDSNKAEDDKENGKKFGVFKLFTMIWKEILRLKKIFFEQNIYSHECSGFNRQ